MIAPAGRRSLRSPAVVVPLGRPSRAAARRGRLGRVPLRVALAATVLVIVAILVAVSPLLAVDEVLVTGAERSGADVVAAAARIEAGDAIVGLDIDRAEARIEALPWVASASIDRSLSGRIGITVTERVPVATANRAGRPMLIDREGRVVGAAVGDEPLPTVGNLRPADVVGSVVRDGQRHLAEILATLPATVHDGLLSLIDDDGELRAIRTDGVVVELGDDSAMRAKFEAVDVVLDRYAPGTVMVVDVRVPNAAAVTTTLPVDT